MKKFLLILPALFMCMLVSAGEKVKINLTCLQGESMINMDADWSELKINNLSLDDWYAYRQAEQPEYDPVHEFEEECKPEFGLLAQKANKEMESIPLMLVKKEGCKYTLLVRPLAIDKKGNNELQCVMINNETQETIADFIIKGDGGHWGSLSNLWGDGFKDAGKQLGGIIKRAIKKEISYSY